MIVLNSQQEAAVTASDGPALVLAGAGTGKTRVIIERLAYLVEERGVDPRQLLALTFTNRAAAEMRQRFAARLEADKVAAWLGTFHSFGMFVLRREMETLGRSKHFTVFDDSDQLSLMKRLIADLPPKYERVSPREALSWISRLKQHCGTPASEEAASDPVALSMRALWTRYHEALLRASAVDFDDLLVLLARLFEEHPDALRRYQNRYRFVHIDEYQDTNRAQYVIAQKLSEAHGNIFAVGDEDQSIYSWRGADIRNILDFSQDFPKATVYRLEQNYRSTQAILDAANALVANNVNRLGKTLRSHESGGERVRFYLADSSENEADWITSDIKKRQLALGDVAVLYRTNAQARAIEEQFRLQGMPYIVVGGIKFYARKEIKDLLAYLRMCINPNDDESLRRIINVPARGIGQTTVEQIGAYARTRAQPIFHVLRDIETDESFSPRARNQVAAFVNLIDDLALDAKSMKLEKLVEKLIDAVGYRSYLQQSDEKDFRSRIDIVEEFVASCAQYDATEGGTLETYLQDRALVSDADDFDPNTPVATLMTCHSAKGLEFLHVYLAGLEEGLLPYIREFDDDRDVEEERRLCYVAMTRARQTLTLTAAQSRTLYGRREDFRELSRFLGEVGPDRLEHVRVKPIATPARSVPGTRGSVRAAGPARSNSTAPSSGGNGDYKTGTKVRHATFGKGTVMFTSGSGDKLKVQVRFQSGKSVKLMVKQAPLEILDS